MRHAFEIDGVEHDVWLGRRPGGDYLLHADGRVVPVSVHAGSGDRAALHVDGVSVPVVIVPHGDTVHVHIDGANWTLRHRHPLDRAHAQAHAASDDEIRAPMPGTVVSVAAKPGDAVARGATLLVIESMKLETTITASRDAVVATVCVAPGQTFERDALLAMLAAPETEA